MRISRDTPRRTPLCVRECVCVLFCVFKLWGLKVPLQTEHLILDCALLCCASLRIPRRHFAAHIRCSHIKQMPSGDRSNLEHAAQTPAAALDGRGNIKSLALSLAFLDQWQAILLFTRR